MLESQAKPLEFPTHFLSHFWEVARRDLPRQDKSEPGAIVVLTICLGRRRAGMRIPLEESEVAAG